MITVATAITLARIALVPLVITTCMYEQWLLAALLATIAVATDFLDGYVARRYQQETALGALLDPVADKLFILGAVTVLWAQALMPGWLMLLLWAKEGMIGVGALYLWRRGLMPPQARLSGKVAMAVQSSACLLLFFTRYTHISSLLILVTGATLYALVDYTHVAYERLKNQ